jgi:hypothetical protein
MKKIIDVILFFFLVLIPLSPLFAQESILSAGGDPSSATGSVSWSVGGIVYSTWIDTTGSVVEGVQQPYEIYITGLGEPGSAGVCTIYPNPSTGKITIRISQSTAKDFSWSLTDQEGRLLMQNSLYEKETAVSIDDLVPSVYFLTVLKNELPLKTYKIIKK